MERVRCCRSHEDFMARYTPLPASVRATAIRELESAMELRSNPGARTIKARRTSTCPISDEKIEVGDSITKTESGWALTKYVRAAKSNPSAGGRAMKYARAHGVPLKQGWAAVKAGKANPLAPSAGPSAKSLMRIAGGYDLHVEPRSPSQVDFHADAGDGEGSGGEYIGSVTVNGDMVIFVGFHPPGKTFTVKILNSAKATRAIVEIVSALHAGYENLPATVEEFASGVLQLVGKVGKANPYYENPSMGGRAMQYSRAHGVSLKEGWKAVKSGRA
jgi:hypothetical protein